MKYSIIIAVKEKNMALPIQENLHPLQTEVLIGENYPSFSKLVNDSILKAGENFNIL